METILESGELWAVSAGLFWAVAVILFKLAGESIPPLPLNLYKGVVALVIFVPLIVITGLPLIPDWPARTWSLLIVSGVIGITVADTLFFMALNRLGAGLNAVVSCLYFPILALLASVFLGEHLAPVTFVGAGLVIAGILLGSDVRGATGRTREQTVSGLTIGVLGLLSLTASVIMVNDILKAEPVLLTTTVRLVAGTVLLAPLVLGGPDRAVAERLFRPSPLWRYALPGAVIGGAMAMLAWIAGFANTSVATAAILNQLSTIYVFVLAALVLKEPVTWRRAVAVAAAFAGAVLVIVAA